MSTGTERACGRALLWLLAAVAHLLPTKKSAIGSWKQTQLWLFVHTENEVVDVDMVERSSKWWRLALLSSVSKDIDSRVAFCVTLEKDTNKKMN